MTILGVIGLTGLLMGEVLAEDMQETTSGAVHDCRYEQHEGGASSSVFPSDDVFRPLMADPKQPQFFATYQSVQRREPTSTVTGVGKSVNVGSVGFGENFGFYSKRHGCNGWQVGLLGGVFSQFNLDAPSSDLINADYIVGIPLSWRQGAWSARVRLYHQSSHVGDEFLLENPGFNRVNLSFEEMEGIVSYEYRWVRMYVGGGYLIHREPAQLDRNRVQWGMELRGATISSPLLGRAMPDLRLTPILGADFKAFEELRWIINHNIIGGVEWSRPGAKRRFRFLVNYYRGFYPYGQFFSEKVESVGFGFYLAF
ncbi:MAG: DUF1207 domain-containing protein [Nitrospira sp.]|nr:DUF1207 domain-containing protein [Nitrospira sp.]QOJ35856.1 MAG: DUF1207 domain-containing protein [Nitrospira sp.]